VRPKPVAPIWLFSSVFANEAFEDFPKCSSLLKRLYAIGSLSYVFMQRLVFNFFDQSCWAKESKVRRKNSRRGNRENAGRFSREQRMTEK
jgi:hypothetical protein